MCTKRNTTLAVLGLSLCIASGAQAISLGEFEYRNSCVACHGASGKGDGPVSDFLSGAEVPDLTVLQKNNNGVFPVSAAYEIIDGTAEVGAHGMRDMLIWGQRYKMRAEADPDFVEPDAYVRTRILALIEYLVTIQE